MSNTRGAAVHAAAMSKVTKNVNSILKNIEKLDRQANEAQAYIDEVVGRVLQGTNDAPGPMADAHELGKVREEVQSRMATYQRLQEEKVQLSRSLYESISTQVAELEKSKTAVEHDMASVAARIARAQAANAALMSSKSSSVAGAGSRGGRKSGRAAAAATTFAPEVVPLPIASAPVIPAHFVPYTFHYPGREPFMEYVDPNEPKYCICNQPSQGDMIGCDNPACTREWFHNICVGIQTPPEKWYCPECREACEGLQPKETSEEPPLKRSTRRS